MMTKNKGPPDGGWGWMCVMGKFFCYFSILGTASSFGIIYIDIIEYFNSTREEAAWIGSLALGLVGLLSPLSSALISKIGLQKTTVAGTVLAFSGCFISWFATGIPYLYASYGIMMATKDPSSYESTKPANCSNILSVLKSSCFLLYAVGTALACLGFIVPFVHLPDMAVQTGIDKHEAAYLISIMGVSNIIGRVVFGWISDFPCVNVIVLQGLSLLTCGVVTIVCPNLTEFYGLAAYAVIYGAFIGVFASMISIAPVSLVGLSRTGEALGIVYCLVGMSNTAASPLAGWLFDITKTYHASFYVTGCIFLLAGMMNISVNFLDRHQRKKQREATNIPVNTVSQSHLDTDQNIQYSCTHEQTYM